MVPRCGNPSLMIPERRSGSSPKTSLIHKQVPVPREIARRQDECERYLGATRPRLGQDARPHERTARTEKGGRTVRGTQESDRPMWASLAEIKVCSRAVLSQRLRRTSNNSGSIPQAHAKTTAGSNRLRNFARAERTPSAAVSQYPQPTHDLFSELLLQHPLAISLLIE